MNRDLLIGYPMNFWLRIGVGLGCIILALWLLWVLVWLLVADSEAAGQFGNMFGAINALFTGFALAGIVVALLMQREELKLQREELGRSSEAQEAQARALIVTAQLNANTALLQNKASERFSEFSHLLGDQETPSDIVGEPSDIRS